MVAIILPPKQKSQLVEFLGQSMVTGMDHNAYFVTSLQPLN